MKCLPCAVHERINHHVYVHIAFGGRGEDCYTVLTGETIKEAYFKYLDKYIKEDFESDPEDFCEGHPFTTWDAYKEFRYMNMHGYDETVESVDVL